MKKLLCLLLCMPFVILSFAKSDAATVGFADEVVNYSFDYSAVGGITAPYGGWFTLPYTSTNVEGVEWDAALGDDPGSDDIYDFLSIWNNSYVIFGFTDETIIDGPGNDIIIRESGPVVQQVVSEGDLGERALISVSSDNSTWYDLGIANSITDDPNVRWLDLSFDIGVDIDGNDTGLSYVSFVKVVGLDFEGVAPGFDLLNIEVLPNSMVTPIPGAVWLLGSGLFGLAVLRRKRIK